jgi:lipopolysaccharide transport system ATP-binding protein
LLKILSRITEPTEGEVRMRGRVASLLEVGTGFHPELTGRENIFLNGAILGMAREEIRRKFDEIVAFAEVERFLDTPVKRYSSGMYVRLAFAVAAHLEPEILVVDEVLAVGDALFQKKCLGKMREVSQQQGRTVLFVSHNMSAISQLTRTAIVLNRGQICFHGPTEDAVSAYAEASEASSTVFFDVEQQPRKWGNQAARFVSLRFDRPCPIFDFEDDFSFIARVKALKDIDRLRFSMTIFNSNGVPVGSSFGPDGPGLQRGETVEALLTMSSPRLAPGQYHCGLGVGHGNHKTGHVDYDVVMDTLNFEVSPERSGEEVMATWTSGWGSISFPPIEMQRVASLQHVES